MSLAGGRRFLWALTGLGAALVQCGMWAPAMAAPGRGYTLSPAFSQVNVPADQPQVLHVVTLTNATSTDQNFRLSTVDFGSLDEQGGVAFLGLPATELEHKYGLASWMKLENDAVLVPAGSAARLSVTIENRATLAPGGHYGAVLATAVTDKGEPTADPRVGVKQVLSTLLLVTKAGGAAPDLDLASQSAGGSWWRMPSHVEQRFHNGGNVHVIPWGIVEIRDTAGRIVRRGAINEDASPILPESYRRYKTPLNATAQAWLPGRYRVVTTYRYDGSDATKTFTTSFWYVGAAIWWLAGLLLAGVAGLLGWWLWWRPKRR